MWNATKDPIKLTVYDDVPPQLFLSAPTGTGNACWSTVSQSDADARLKAMNDNGLLGRIDNSLSDTRACWASRGLASFPWSFEALGLGLYVARCYEVGWRDCGVIDDFGGLERVDICQLEVSLRN